MDFGCERWLGKRGEEEESVLGGAGQEAKEKTDCLVELLKSRTLCLTFAVSKPVRFLVNCQVSSAY